MEKFSNIPDVAKQPEAQPKNAVENFWDQLSKDSSERQTPDILKNENALAKWWKNLSSTESSETVSEFGKNQNEAETTVSETDIAEKISEAKKEYLADLKKNSEYPETIQAEDTPYEKISPEENAARRMEFRENKEVLIKAWEDKYQTEWPRYKEDLYFNAHLIRRAGDRYDAHHVHPLSLGGKNEAGNLTPISAEKHFDKQGVHAPDSFYGQIEKLCKEREV